MSSKEFEYKKYLDPQVVSKIKTYDLKARLVVEGFKVGLHKSPYHGFSVEFSEHRPYMQGDAIKNIDWKILAKTDKFFIKQYEEETNLITHLIIDSSESMRFKSEGVISKFEYSKILASALSYLMMNQQDAVGAYFFSNKIENGLPPKSSKTYLKNILKLISAQETKNSTNTSKSLFNIANKLKKRGMVIIISDFLDDMENIVNALKLFHSKKNEVILFQILDPLEQSFNFKKDSRFVDLETGEELTTQPPQLQKAYHSGIKNFISKLKSECNKLGIEHNLIQTDSPFDKALFAYFKKRARLH